MLNLELYFYFLSGAHWFWTRTHGFSEDESQDSPQLFVPKSLYRPFSKILFFVPPKFCISIVFNFSWDLQSPQEKLETMLMQNFGGTKKSIMVFLKKAYSPLQKLQGDWVQALGVVV